MLQSELPDKKFKNLECESQNPENSRVCFSKFGKKSRKAFDDQFYLLNVLFSPPGYQ
jgi:hypothetical protein